MKRALKLTLCAGLTVTCGFGAIACVGGGNDDAGKTVITVNHYSGGVGDAWVDDAVARFEEMYKDEVFEEGKTGVSVKFDNYETGTSIDDIQTSGDNMYIVSAGGKLQKFIQSGYLLEISDVVTKTDITDPKGEKTIESKLINPRDVQDAEGRYYALPHYEIYDGVSYDIDVFNDYNLFLAAPDEGKEYSKTGVYFVENSDTKKSCGADGVYGTSDDGLPTTLEEMVVLCENMASQGVTPFYFAGYQKNYPSYLSLGLWAALAGKEGMSVNFTLDGEIDKVTGEASTPLFDGYDIPAPTVEEGYQITADTYKDVYDSVERYYSVAFTELLWQKDWIKATSENTSHTDAIFTFMLNDKTTKYGMFIEGSYWYALAQKYGYDEMYKEAYPENADRNVAWMPLPTALKKEDAVTEGNGRAVAQLEFGGSYTFINGNIANDEGKVKACKAFIEFLYSDNELSAFTRATGTAKALKYDLAESDYNALSTYQKGVWDVRKQDAVVYQSSDSELFLSNTETFRLSNTHISVRPYYGATQYASYWFAFESEANTTSWEMFQKSSLRNGTLA